MKNIQKIKNKQGKERLLFRLCFGLSLLVYGLSLGHCANVKGKVFGDNSCSFSRKAFAFSKGDGTPGSPYVIYTCPGLALISDDLSAHYKLGGDIDASGGDWTPIGDNSTNDADSRFTGSLDGNGYLISHLTVGIEIDSGAAYGGFFGHIDGAVISNIALQDLSITVNQNSTRDEAYAGGLVGREDDGTISNSYATGAVTVTSQANGTVYVGGLVGRNGGGQMISNSYARVSVTVRNQRSRVKAGGLLGRSGARINNSYATGQATCDTSCSDALIGGLVGDREGGAVAVMNSYWDTDSTRTMNGCGDPDMDCGGGATGLRTAQMQKVTADPMTSPIGLGDDAFQFSAGSYPKLYRCEIDSTTNACSGSFTTELLPGQ